MPRINEQVIYTMPVFVEDPEYSPTYKYRKRGGHDIVRYSVYGTGGSASGAYQLQVCLADSEDWISVADGAFTDTQASGTFVPGNNCDLRWLCASGSDGNTIVTIG
jgi:hypothetical protein